MTPTHAPLKRFILHSLWVVLPFCALLVLTWNAWRADSEIRKQRTLESANRIATKTLNEIRDELRPWVPIPKTNLTEIPPTPASDTEALEAWKRYNSGDYEGVLGSPKSLRSPAGLSLRSLAALQLLRKETDPVRLAELTALLAEDLDFTSPSFLSAAEKRFHELMIELPSSLVDWRKRWQRAHSELSFLKQLDGANLAAWHEDQYIDYLIEVNPQSTEWRVNTSEEIREAARHVLKNPDSLNLADGLAMQLGVSGRTIVGSPGIKTLSTSDDNGWRAEVVLVDVTAYNRSERRSRNFMTAIIVGGSIALLFGLYLSGKAYLRAVELARRQSEFVAAVSHEMRTPLTAMGLLAENLESGAAERAGQNAEHLRMIREESARLGGLIDNVLAFAHDRKLETHEAIDLPAMIADAVSLIKPLADRNGIKLEVEVAEFPEAPCGDAVALRRALLNLLDNAIKHTPASGMVSCIAKPLKENHWCIEVTDSGPGIAVQERSRIFDVFYRIGDELRRTTSGTGLGLALVKRTADAHGGRIEVSDAPAGGCRFILTLPIHS